MLNCKRRACERVLLFFSRKNCNISSSGGSISTRATTQSVCIYARLFSRICVRKIVQLEEKVYIEICIGRYMYTGVSGIRRYMYSYLEQVMCDVCVCVVACVCWGLVCECVSVRICVHTHIHTYLQTNKHTNILTFLHKCATLQAVRLRYKVS